MNRTIGAMILALFLVSPFAFADVELKGAVVKVDRAENHLMVKTERGEETLLIDKTTKGVETVKQGAKVIVKFTEKNGEPKVTEIVSQEDGPTQIAPR